MFRGVVLLGILVPSAVALAQQPVSPRRDWANGPERGLLNPVNISGENRQPTAQGSVTTVQFTERTPGLPRDHGQLWRDYDISPFTDRFPDDDRPQQEIVDWILRETGTEVWFSPPVGLLNANRENISVFHTPELQESVRTIIDRFVNVDASHCSLGVRLVTVQNPNWRLRRRSFLRPVEISAPGLDAWLLSKEASAVVLADLRRTRGFRQYTSPNQLVPNGWTLTLSRIQPRTYIKSVQSVSNEWPGYSTDVGQLKEGFALDVSPLLSRDGETVDVAVKCQVDQIEKLTPLTVDLPSVETPRQRIQIQVPQLSAWGLNERFRWPTDDVLLISRGVVACPGRSDFRLGLPDSLPLVSAPRAEALLFLECHRIVHSSVAGREFPSTGGVDYRGRY